MAVKIIEPSSSSSASSGGAPQNEQQPLNSLTEIIHSHFDTHQHDANDSTSAANRAAASLRSEILTYTNGTFDEDVCNEVSDTLVRVLDSTMAVINATSKKSQCYADSVSAVLALIAAFGCNNSMASKDAEGNIATAVIYRAVEYSAVEKDTIRLEACKLLGLCSTYLVEGKLASGGILKKKNSKNKGSTAANKAAGGAVAVDVPSWKMDCLISLASALQPRTTDKIAKVRNTAISSTASILSIESLQTFGTLNEEYKGTTTNIQGSLLWLLKNDSSATNRALIPTILPLKSVNVYGEEEQREYGTDEVNVETVIERIKDVDVKVREAALEALKNGVDLGELNEDLRVEILRMGLTKRCATTYAKTVELLITSWLKSTKFNPLALLDQLNPVLNETVCVQVATVLIQVASTIDCETILGADGVARGVDLIKGQFGGPEVRSLQKEVLKRMNVNDVESTPKSTTEDEVEEGAEEEAESKPSLAPSKALFLRVKCALATSNKSEIISDIITDIPNLCNLLTTHIDNLIEFNSNDEYDEIDEDEAAEYEDVQNFICLQLIHMAKSSELQEEGSRRHFLSIMRRILSRLATPDDLVDMCVKSMAVAHDTESQFLQTISEILVDVEEDDTFHTKEDMDERAIVIVRQMRIIAILSIVLESISGALVGHPILDSFFEHLSPAITSKNAIVREHGVICLSKFCLLSEEKKVRGEFKPLLMTVAGSVEERVEVRAQAALALCDLALIHERMLLGDSNVESKNGDDDDSKDEKSMPFKDMLLEMLSHSKPGIVIIAAEIAAKLLLSGRINDPNLIAWLVLIYFDTSLTAMDIDEEDADGSAVKEVGSPVRLQQLLSIFFPTYSMSSLDANDDMMASVGPLISIVNEKLAGVKKNANGKEILAQWPVAKMIEYICYNVDLADKKKNVESESKAEKKSVAAESVNGEQTVVDTVAEESQASHFSDADKEAETEGEVVENDKEKEEKEDDENVVEASSTLLASIDIADFLAEQCDEAPTFYNRALAKILGSACIDIESEDSALLCRLKANVNEAEYANDDGPTVKSIRKLTDLLVDVEDQVSDDEESVSSEEDNEAREEEEEEVADEEDTVVEDANIVSTEKENPRMSVGSVKSTKSNVEVENRRSLNRTSLGDVSCN